MSLALRVTQPAPESSEQELVAAVRRGDDRAFEELYARYRSRIGSYIFGMVGDHGRAEDIVQEVFISALRRLRENERTIIFKPWIYEIAKNACIDEFRRTRRIHEVPLETDDDREFPVAAMPSTSPTPDAAVESKQRLTDLRGAFRGLSESHHRILVLRELEGLSYNQIGDRLGMSKPVVESTLFRARRRLGEEFEELESGRRCQRVQSLIASAGERPLRSLGIRERRQFARHVAHCEPCLRQAREASVDESLYRAPNLLGRMALLAPLPWVRSLVLYLDPARPGSGVGRAIAAAIVVAGAGAGGGLMSDMTGHAGRPPDAVLAAPLPPVGVAAPRSSAIPAMSVSPPAAGSRAIQAASAAGVVKARATHSPASPSPASGSAHRASPGSAQSQTRGHPTGLPPSGATAGGPRLGAGTPAGLGSGGSTTSQPAGGTAQPGAAAGAVGGGAPSGAAPGAGLAQTGSGVLGVVQQGLGSLPVKPPSLPGGTAIGSTQIPSLPSLPLNAGGSGAGASGATSSPSGPAQPSSGGATSTTSQSPAGTTNGAGQALPILGLSRSA